MPGASVQLKIETIGAQAAAQAVGQTTMAMNQAAVAAAGLRAAREAMAREAKAQAASEAALRSTLLSHQRELKVAAPATAGSKAEAYFSGKAHYKELENAVPPVLDSIGGAASRSGKQAANAANGHQKLGAALAAVAGAGGPLASVLMQTNQLFDSSVPKAERFGAALKGIGFAALAYEASVLVGRVQQIGQAFDEANKARVEIGQKPQSGLRNAVDAYVDAGDSGGVGGFLYNGIAGRLLRKAGYGTQNNVAADASTDKSGIHTRQMEGYSKRMADEKSPEAVAASRLRDSKSAFTYDQYKAEVEKARMELEPSKAQGPTIGGTVGSIVDQLAKVSEAYQKMQGLRQDLADKRGAIGATETETEIQRLDQELRAMTTAANGQKGILDDIANYRQEKVWAIKAAAQKADEALFNEDARKRTAAQQASAQAILGQLSTASDATGKEMDTAKEAEQGATDAQTEHRKRALTPSHVLLAQNRAFMRDVRKTVREDKKLNTIADRAEDKAGRGERLTAREDAALKWRADTKDKENAGDQQVLLRDKQIKMADDMKEIRKQLESMSKAVGVAGGT